MNREEIQKEIENKKAQIRELRNQIQELYQQDCLLCDDEQWYTEEEEVTVVSKRPKKTEKHLIGRIHWISSFRNEDYPEDDARGWTKVERTEIVKVDGKWL